MQQIKDENEPKDADLSSDCKTDGSREIYLMDN